MSVPTYLGSQVFPIEIDTLQPLASGLIWDARGRRLNFGGISGDFPAHTARHAYFDLRAFPADSTERADLREFLDSTRGCVPFWVVDPAAQPALLSATTTALTVAAANWADWYALGYTHCACTVAGATVYREISSVGTSGSNEVLNLGTATASAATAVAFLRYVRLAEDLVAAEYLADNTPECTLRVLDLPAEYGDTLATPQVHVYLYDLTWTAGGDTVTLRLTSAPQDLTFSGETYTAAEISHRDIERRLDGQNSATLEWATFTSHPATWPQARWTVTIRSAAYDLDAAYITDTARILFTGRGGRITLDGSHYSMPCYGRLNRPGERFPRYVYTRYAQSAADDYGASPDSLAADIDSVSGATLVCSGSDLGTADAADYRADGWLVTSRAHPERETAGILAIAVDGSEWTLTLDTPLTFADGDDTVTIYRLRADTMAEWLAAGADQVDFRGHPDIDVLGLQLGAITRSTPSPQKK